jgi:hypothetical protein
MEKRKLTTRSLSFLSGLLFGGLLFGVFILITGSKPSEPPAFTGNIPVATAKAYYHQYLSHPVRPDTLKALAIDLDQLGAMNSILSQNTHVTGFRIYYGLDNSQTKVGLAVGIDTYGHDIVTNIVQTTRSIDPCPPICDSQSQIMKN